MNKIRDLFYRALGRKRHPVQMPFELSLGLKLDSPPLILPWDKELEELKKIGSPRLNKYPEESFITWKGNSVFEGIKADVMYRSGSKNIYWLDINRKKKFLNAKEEYDFVLPQLVERFEKPHYSVIDGGYPWVRWHYNDVRISLRIAERFVEYVSFMVSKGL
jgi:hypothetical protein